MAEMLVRTVDKVNKEDVYLDCKCTKRGHVIEICPDGWQWSQAERTAPYWTIIKAPGVSVHDLSAYLAHEPGDPKVNRMLQRRAFKFDLDTLALSATTATTAMAMTVDTSVTSSNDLTLDQALALKVAVAPLSDPAVL